jgi:hypothetical protein
MPQSLNGFFRKKSHDARTGKGHNLENPLLTAGKFAQDPYASLV